jgi:hypothetical protein
MSQQGSDHESDPRLDDGEAVDWASEGGATTGGPATDPEDGTPDEGRDEDHEAE